MSVVGKDVIVYCRHLFSVPVKGVIQSVSDHDGAYQVIFNPDNPGGRNVTKHSGSYFLKEQCRIDGDIEDCCETCKWMHEGTWNNDANKKYFECRRHSPRCCLTDSEEGLGCFPSTSPKNYCGDHKKK